MSTIGQRLPKPVQRMITRIKLGHPFSPLSGKIKFGDLRRLVPISRVYGWDRGTPVDRHYIETFLGAHSDLIRGDVLEISEDTYTKKFGGSAVTKSDVLHYDDPSPPATMTGDLTNAPHVPSESYDCIIITQTLMLIYDLPAAIETLHRLLKPGGTVLATMAGVTQIADREWQDVWYWSFSAASGRKIFEDGFPGGTVESRSYGNVLTTMAFLQGIGMEELTRKELDHQDPDYQLLVGVVARKAAAAE
ncbi:methyltransferase domain-containing protein [Palleronia marisminoris]|uniref:methyltransferase domain-containing protein n=1 Tax=Palleronia marisminoris TaxID=315423 RepID=UPI001587F11D|nr:methyltransferase domain-containing protein [Palleronia marisminoris]